MESITAADLLPRILSQLDDPCCHAKVETICPKWRSASAEATPVRLVYQQPRILDAACSGLPRWFQRQFTLNRLEKLSEVELIAYGRDLDASREWTEGDEPRLLQSLFVGVVMVLGMTNLTTCRLEGFEGWVQDLLLLLPDSLQVLSLSPGGKTNNTYHSSDFAKFASLQSLTLTLSADESGFEFMGNHVLPHLVTLKLHNGTLILDNMNEDTVKGLFPMLSEIVTNAKFYDGWQVDSVNEFLEVLAHVTLSVVCDYSEFSDHTELNVYPSSHLTNLNISVTDRQHVTINLHRAGVQVHVLGESLRASITIVVK